MSGYPAPADTAQALAAVGLPHPGGDPRRLRERAGAHDALADGLAAHAERIADLLRRSEELWQGGAADAFAGGTAAQAARAALMARTAARLGQAHAEHAEKTHRALEIVEELAIQIAATLVIMAAAAWFPPLLAVVEAQLAALAATAGRFLQWLADLLSALVRFLLRARTWIGEVSRLTWRTDTFSVGYGKLLHDGLRDAVVDVLAGLTNRGITHKPLDLTLLWSALGSGVAGGVFGAVEASGARKVLTAAGRIERTADGLPRYVPFGDQAKAWAGGLGRSRSAADGTAAPVPPTAPGAVERVPGRTEIARALGGPGPLERWRTARAQVRGHGLRGLPGERDVLAGEMAGARAVSEAADTALRTARDGLGRARAQLAAADADIAAHTRALTERPRTEGAAADAAHHRAALTAARQARATAARDVTAASGAVRETERTADAARRELDGVRERHRAWREFADAGTGVRAQVPVRARLVDAWRHNVWKEGLATGYRTTPAGAAVPASWAKENVSGFGDLALKALGSPKPWRQVVLYEGGLSFLKGSLGNAIATGLAFEPGRTDPRVWLGVPLAGAGGAARGALRGAVHNRTVPDKSVEDAVFALGLSSLSKEINGVAVREIAP
ncbi:hypothetical protein [Streptomyces sp. NPDC002067]